MSSPVLARRLAEQGYSVERIAEEVGRSVAWVRGNIPPHVDIRNLEESNKRLKFALLQIDLLSSHPTNNSREIRNVAREALKKEGV